ncbi:MAG: transglutaminase-like domain-containing protein [Bacteroidales bacterium]|jgi:transglutaminase-like putative cysteine protease
MIFPYAFRSIFLILLLAVFSRNCVAQKIETSKEDIAFAEKLSTIYPNEKVVSPEYSVKINFEYLSSSPGSFPVGAVMKISNTLVSLRDEVSYTGALFYDKQSNINHVSATNAKGKKVESFNYVYRNIESEGIFYDDAKICDYIASFNSKGEKITICANKSYYDVKYLTSFFFHEDFPILKYTLEVNVPGWLDIEMIEKNFEGYIINKNVELDEKHKCKKYTYTLNNLYAFKEERNSPHPSRELPHLVFLSKNYTDTEGKNNKLFDSLNDLYTWYYQLIPHDTTHSAELTNLVQSLTKDKTDDIGKIKAIYYWVQDNIRYIAFENGIMGFKPEKPDKVFQNRYGDCKGSASLLKELLLIAGFDARLTWLGTKRLSYDYSTPSLVVDNHMICTLFFNNKEFFLDPTYEYCPFPENNYQIQGRQVLIENKKNYILDTIPDAGPEFNSIVTDVKMEIDPEKEILKASSNATYKGEEKNELFYYYHSLSGEKKEENIKKYLSGDNKNIHITNYSAFDFENRDIPLSISLNYNIDNGIIKTEKELYVNMNNGVDFTLNVFDTTRHNDYEFYNVFSNNATIEFTIPAGYNISYLPEKIIVENNYFAGSYSYEKNGNIILLKKQYILKKDLVKKRDFVNWNKEANQINNFLKDQVILKKI